jgi:hypothetical protein
MRLQIAPIRAIGLLAGIMANGALLIWISVLVTADTSTTLSKGNWNADLAGPIAGPAVRKPLESYAPILAHPVFFKSRAPYVPAPPAPRPPAAAPPMAIDPGLAVSGVIITNGLSKAYLSNRARTDGTWTAEGQVFQGWRVTSVDKAGVKLEQSGRSVTLTLYPRD